jgi:4-oxalocrotonate tautomerase
VPFVEVKAFEQRVDDASAARIIAAVTDALCSVWGEGVRDATWVTVEGLPPARWGIGGSPSAPPAPQGPA